MSVVYERDVTDMVTITLLREENRDLKEQLRIVLEHLEEQKAINSRLMKELNNIESTLDDD